MRTLFILCIIIIYRLGGGFPIMWWCMYVHVSPGTMWHVKTLLCTWVSQSRIWMWRLPQINVALNMSAWTLWSCSTPLVWLYHCVELTVWWIFIFTLTKLGSQCTVCGSELVCRETGRRLESVQLLNGLPGLLVDFHSNRNIRGCGFRVLAMCVRRTFFEANSCTLPGPPVPVTSPPPFPPGFGKRVWYNMLLASSVSINKHFTPHTHTLFGLFTYTGSKLAIGTAVLYLAIISNPQVPVHL